MKNDIQESIEAEDSKDTPSCGTEASDLEIIHRQGTEAGHSGSWASTPSRGQFTPQMEQTTRESWGQASID